MGGRFLRNVELITWMAAGEAPVGLYVANWDCVGLLWGVVGRAHRKGGLVKRWIGL
jgi:hypothetical protein